MGLSVRLEAVSHRYVESGESAAVDALSDVKMQIEAGSFVVLMGPSGSGKSTLLNIIGGVERPTKGRVLLDGADIARFSETALTLLRRRSAGYVFQFFNLIPALTVEENVGFPLSLAGVRRDEAARRVDETLVRLGMSHRRTHYPSMLSGGEMQRVAIGRAIIHRPGLLLADEPTGNLDSRTGDQILELLSEVRREFQPTVVMATHSHHAASYGDCRIAVTDGRVAPAVALT